MNIIVTIKQVPNTNVIKINPVTGTLIRDGVPSILNPDDASALEMALQLKDKFGAHVTVITMGPPQADAICREAFAMGADRAILLSDRKFAGADTLATSYALSGAIKTLDYDLILAGRQAIDGDTAQTPVSLAQHLDLPQVTYATNLDFDGKKLCTVTKETEEGYQILEVETPCVLTVLSSAIKPRYMTVKGIMEAYDKEVEVWGADKLDVEEARLGLSGSPTRVKKSFTKPQKQPGEVFEVDPEEAVEIIVKKLKEKHII